MSLIRLPKGSVSPFSALKKDDQPPRSDVGGRQQSPKSFRESEKGKPEGATAGSALTIMSTVGPDSAFQVTVTEALVFLTTCPL